MNDEPRIQELAEETTADDVATVLRERIFGGELRVGASLPTQASLVEEFGVQRTVIRQALKYLQREGLLAEVTRGAPPRVADWSARAAAPDGTPLETMVALGPRVTEAFEATDVRIDALCLTAESLTAVFGEQRRLIRARGTAPATVTVRLLMPDRDIDLAFPRKVFNEPVEDSADDETDPVHDRWLTQRNAHGVVLRNHLLALRSAYGTQVDVQFKALPFTPPVKLYLLNGSEALFAYYQVTRREEEIDETPVEMFDALGIESPLFHFTSGEGQLRRDMAFVEQSQAWFNALWNTIAGRLKLG
jgi:regulatory GntR family protein